MITENSKKVNSNERNPKKNRYISIIYYNNGLKRGFGGETLEDIPLHRATFATWDQGVSFWNSLF